MKSKLILAALVAATAFATNVNAQTWNLAGNAGITAAQYLGTTDAQPIRFKVNAIERMTLNSSGKLGIGNTSPVGKADVYTIADSRAINLNNQFNTTATIYGVYSLANNIGTGGAYGSYSKSSGLGGTNIGAYGTAGDGATNYGVYGLGSTGTGITGYGVYGYALGAGTNYGVYGKSVGGTVNWAGYFEGNNYVSGSFGLGTTSFADCKLAVQQTGTSIATVKFLNTSMGANISWIHFGTTGDWYIRSASNSGKVVIQDQASGTAPVCIGTTQVATGYKLSVAGKIMCEELKVLLRASWPDYVFAKDYKLLSLHELENFVNENNHLPGVPSASAVEKEGGFEVGQMQSVLLQKLEEANLYILQLNKRIEALEAKAGK